MLYDPTYRSFCDVNATVSCTQVYQSRFSTFLGIPVALFGAVWFVAAALLSVAGLTAHQSVRENIPGYLFALSTLALAVVLYLGYASLVLIKAVCLLCLTTYAAVIVLFIVSGAATTFPMTTLPRRVAADARLFLRSPIALTIACPVPRRRRDDLAFFPREGAADRRRPAAAAPALTQDQRSEFERWSCSQPRIPLIVPAEGAKVLIVKFNDFQCPACGQSYLHYKPILAKYEAEHPGAVKMVLKDYPLEPRLQRRHCADAPPGGVRRGRRRAARAKRTTRRRDGRVALHAPAGDDAAAVRQAARDIGGVTDFDAKYAVDARAWSKATSRSASSSTSRRRRPSSSTASRSRRAARRSTSSRRSPTSCSTPSKGAHSQ